MFHSANGPDATLTIIFWLKKNKKQKKTNQMATKKLIANKRLLDVSPRISLSCCYSSCYLAPSSLDDLILSCNNQITTHQRHTYTCQQFNTFYHLHKTQARSLTLCRLIWWSKYRYDQSRSEYKKTKTGPRPGVCAVQRGTTTLKKKNCTKNGKYDSSWYELVTMVELCSWLGRCCCTNGFRW